MSGTRYGKERREELRDMFVDLIVREGPKRADDLQRYADDVESRHVAIIVKHCDRLVYDGNGRIHVTGEVS